MVNFLDKLTLMIVVALFVFGVPALTASAADGIVSDPVEMVYVEQLPAGDSLAFQEDGQLATDFDAALLEIAQYLAWLIKFLGFWAVNAFAIAGFLEISVKPKLKDLALNDNVKWFSDWGKVLILGGASFAWGVAWFVKGNVNTLDGVPGGYFSETPDYFFALAHGSFGVIAATLGHHRIEQFIAWAKRGQAALDALHPSDAENPPSTPRESDLAREARLRVGDRFA